jgi:flagellar basal body-associated protein FliL
MNASPAPHKLNLTLVIVAVIVVIVAVAGIGYYLYQGSLQPNIQVLNLQFGSAQTSPQNSIVQDQGRVSGSDTFSYTATMSGVAYLVFDNTFSTFSSKQVSVAYSVAGSQNSQSFVVDAGNVNTIGVQMYSGQTVSGTFTASGGSGNDVDFSIILYTCSQTIPFTANIVNSGGANGYAVVSIQIQSSSNGVSTVGPSSTSTTTAAGGSSGNVPLVLSGTVFSEKYYAPKGQQEPISGTASILDCGTHTFSAVVSQQQKA